MVWRRYVSVWNNWTVGWGDGLKMKIEYIIEILPSLVSKIPVVFIVFILSFITALILAIAIVLIRKIEIPIINTILFTFILLQSPNAVGYAK